LLPKERKNHLFTVQFASIHNKPIRTSRKHRISKKEIPLFAVVWMVSNPPASILI
jgi:hypothetical protein